MGSERHKSRPVSLADEFPVLDIKKLGEFPKSITILSGRNPRTLKTYEVRGIVSATTEQKKDLQAIANKYTLRTSEGLIDLKHDLINQTWEITSVEQLP